MKRVIALIMVFTILIGFIPNKNVYAVNLSDFLNFEKFEDVNLVDKIKDVFSKGEEYFKDKIKRFSDLGKHWSDVTVGKLVEYGVIDGYKDGTFKPNNTITRAEFTKIIRNALKLKLVEGNSFEDTTKHWAKNEIHTVVLNGGINKSEYGNNFEPNKEITRIEMAKIIVRSLGLDKEASSKAGQNTGFNDDSAIAYADKGYIIIASENQIIKGYPNNTFQPNGKATRAEASQMIINMLEAISKEEEKKEETKEEVVKRVNKTLETRKTNIQLPKGVKSVAKYDKPKTYEELQTNIEELKEYDFSVKKKSNWELIALDQFISNSSEYEFSTGVVGVIKMELPKGSRLSTIDFEGKKYDALYNDELISKNFRTGFLIKDGEIIDRISKVSDYYSLGLSKNESIYKADYISFSQVGAEIFTSSVEFKHYGERILVVFENPFKK